MYGEGYSTASNVPWVHCSVSEVMVCMFRMMVLPMTYLGHTILAVRWCYVWRGLYGTACDVRWVHCTVCDVMLCMSITYLGYTVLSVMWSCVCLWCTLGTLSGLWCDVMYVYDVPFVHCLVCDVMLCMSMTSLLYTVQSVRWCCVCLWRTLGTLSWLWGDAIYRENVPWVHCPSCEVVMVLSMTYLGYTLQSVMWCYVCRAECRGRWRWLWVGIGQQVAWHTR